MNRSTGRRFTVVLAVVALAACTLSCATIELLGLKRVSLQEQLQGKWTARAVDQDVDIPTMTIHGNKIHIETSTGDYFDGTLKINEDVSPAQMDLTVTDSSMAEAVDITAEGIVKVEGKKMNWCLQLDSSYGRPTAFDTGQGMLIVGEKK